MDDTTPLTRAVVWVTVVIIVGAIGVACNDTSTTRPTAASSASTGASTSVGSTEATSLPSTTPSSATPPPASEPPASASQVIVTVAGNVAEILANGDLTLN